MNMRSIQYRLLEMSLDSRKFHMLQFHDLGSATVMTVPGYTIPQVLRWNYPVISRAAELSGPAGSNKYAVYSGVVYQLYEDANDVAGLSELLADGFKAKVPALR